MPNVNPKSQYAKKKEKWDGAEDPTINNFHTLDKSKF